jgi:hypothetical protein
MSTYHRVVPAFLWGAIDRLGVVECCGKNFPVTAKSKFCCRSRRDWNPCYHRERVLLQAVQQLRGGWSRNNKRKTAECLAFVEHGCTP